MDTQTVTMECDQSYDPKMSSKICRSKKEAPGPDRKTGRASGGDGIPVSETSRHKSSARSSEEGAVEKRNWKEGRAGLEWEMAGLSGQGVGVAAAQSTGGEEGDSDPREVWGPHTSLPC